MTWLRALPANRRRGSCPRCLLLLDGDRKAVAERLTGIIGMPNVTVTAQDIWMPQGLPMRTLDGAWDKDPCREAKLGEAEGLLSAEDRVAVTKWWLVVPKMANTPNWDIASTCSINGTRGLLLVEAKAHDMELRREAASKRLKADASENSRRNHEKIGRCIDGACRVFSRETKLSWNISRDRNYQMSNRFAWACKLTELGYAVVLVYLGFLSATEMTDRGKPLASGDEWTQVVKAHSEGLVPAEAWNQAWTVHGHPFLPLIRSTRVDLPAAASCGDLP